MKDLDLFETYKDLVGLPFKLGAQGPKEYDCYSLVKEIAHRRGFFLPVVNTPDDIELRLKLLESISNEYTELIVKPEPFCIVIFDLGPFGKIHCGIVLADCRQFIHSAAFIKRVRIDRLSSYPFRGRIFGFFRLCKRI